MRFWEPLRRLLNPGQNTESDPDIPKFEQLIGYRFRDRNLLLLSLTHRSYFQNDGGRSPANERLEFLGDSVLGLVISHKLYDDHPELREGELTKMKAQLVNEIGLAMVGKKIGLNNFLRMSPDERRSGGCERASIISDAFESVIAAVYLDGGMGPARDVILRTIYTSKTELTSAESQRNYKGELLEKVQANGDGMPRYDVISEDGPDHDKTFHIDVYIDNQLYGTGRGSSKKEAEQKAAAQALEQYSC
ncbi:MAG: ribonuclease III [bacterium]|nr:ribonuclease III [bacterium]